MANFLAVALTDLLNKVAQEKKRNSCTDGISMVACTKAWIVPIPGTTKLNRLKENLGALNVELTADDLREIEEAAPKITIQGARYSEQHERLTSR